jgi:hypothetical protein
MAKNVMAVLLWSISKTRNRAYFDVMPNDPYDIIFLIFHNIDYWIDIHKTRTKRALCRGADQLKVIAKHVFSKVKGCVPLCRRIEVDSFYE